MSLMGRVSAYRSWEQVHSDSRRLADLVSSSDASLVVGISEGGVLPGVIVSEALGLPYAELDVGRPYDVGSFHHSYTGWLAEALQIMCFYVRSPVIRGYVGPVLSGERVLLIDDVCHTGRTLRVAGQHLAAAGARVVEEGVIARVGRGACSAVLEGRFRFPWSKDAPDRARFDDWLASRNNYKRSA